MKKLTESEIDEYIITHEGITMLNSCPDCKAHEMIVKVRDDKLNCEIKEVTCLTCGRQVRVP